MILFICKHCGNPTGVYLDIKTNKLVNKNDINKIKYQDIGLRYRYFISFCENCHYIFPYSWNNIQSNIEWKD